MVSSLSSSKRIILLYWLKLMLKLQHYLLSILLNLLLFQLFQHDQFMPLDYLHHIQQFHHVHLLLQMLKMQLFQVALLQQQIRNLWYSNFYLIHQVSLFLQQLKQIYQAFYSYMLLYHFNYIISYIKHFYIKLLYNVMVDQVNMECIHKLY